MEGEEVNIPGNQGEVVKVGVRRVEEEAAGQKRRRTRRDRVAQRSPAEDRARAVTAERSAAPGMSFVSARGGGGTRHVTGRPYRVGSQHG